MEKYDNFIDGKYLSSSEYLPNENPSDHSDTIGHYAAADQETTHKAIQAARQAAATWGFSGVQERFDILDATGSRLLAQRAELGKLLAREEGKTLAEAIGEVGRAAMVFKFFAGEALRSGGELVPSVRSGLTVEITREPVGVVGLITPWNFPIAIVAWKMAAALAFGNTVVLKPSEFAPGCAWSLVKMLHDCGLPPGVVNLVMGKGELVGDTLVRSPDVDAISFTGSSAVGNKIAEICGKSKKKAQLEMGGKNPLLVLDDADIDIAVDAAVNGSFFQTGQRCTASSRLIVTEGIYARFIAEMKEKMKSLKIGHALYADTQIGPVVSDPQLQKNMAYVQRAAADGCGIFGGELLDRDTRGFFMSPALVTESLNHMPINREEVFGPVASVILVKDYEEALSVANDTPFGLSAGLCTTSLKHAAHFKRHSESGLVMINAPTAGLDYHVPFGGRKSSSFGPREQGAYAREFYTIVKTSYVRAA